MSAAPPPEFDLATSGLARAWAEATSRTTYLVMSSAEIEKFLTVLITRLITAVRATPVDEQAARAVAAELVAHDFTGSHSIGRSIEVLGRGLPQLPQLRDLEGLDAALMRILSALCD